MKWITRERVKVDRVACPWLIKHWSTRMRSLSRDGGSALLTAHAECKASLTPMGIHRDHPPMDSIAARRQRFEGNAYHVALT